MDFDTAFAERLRLKYGTEPDSYDKSIGKRLDRIYNAQKYALGLVKLKMAGGGIGDWLGVIADPINATAATKKLTTEQVAMVAHQAGFRGENLVTVTAIAFAESGGNSLSHNPVPPDDSYGLWQINMIGKLGPNRRSKFGLTSNEELYYPLVNAKAAFYISGGQNFGPWTTYTSGKYRTYLEASRVACRTAGLL